MAPPTTTRSSIRRALGRNARLEFFMRYGAGYVALTSAGDTTALVLTSTSLSQDTDFWKAAWVYAVESSEERYITQSSSDGALHMEFAETAASTSGDLIEIWDQWPPSAVHQAINQAHRNSWRFFPDIRICENVIICEDKLKYGLATSDLNGPDTADDNPAVAEVLQVWIERSNNAVNGQITSTSATSNAANDTESTPDTDADSDYLISFYDGVGVGQLREVVSWDSDGLITWDTEAATEPDTTTKYKIWHPEVGAQVEDWYKLTAARFVPLEYPDYMYLTQRYPSAYGLRMRLIYSAQTTDFADDTATTYVPEEWLLWKTLAILHAGVVGDNRADRASEAGLASYYDELAQKFVADEGRTLPAMTHWVEKDVSGYSAYSDDQNPLGW